MKMNEITLLLVEDEETILNSLYNLLSRFFKEVITATNGKDGLEQYLENKNDINLILTDIRMPEMNGIEMLKEIKIVDEDLPTYIISGEPSFKSEAEDLGVRKFFDKPLMVPELFEKIKIDFE